MATLESLPRKPDLVIATGDLVDCGLAEEYEELADLLDRCPCRSTSCRATTTVVPSCSTSSGRTATSGEDDGFLHYVVEGHAVRLIGLDTVVPGHGHGEMDAPAAGMAQRPPARGAGRARRSSSCITRPSRTGLGDMDRINCRNGAALAELLRDFVNIERVVCGHHHRPITVRWGGTIGSVAPSTAHQVTLDLIPDNSPATFTMEPPGFQLHLWTPEAGIVTHTVPIGSFEGPFPFVLDADYPGHAAKAEAA